MDVFKERKKQKTLSNVFRVTFLEKKKRKKEEKKEKKEKKKKKKKRKAHSRGNTFQPPKEGYSLEMCS